MLRTRIEGTAREISLGPIKTTKERDAQKKADIFMGQIAAGMDYEDALAHVRGRTVPQPGTGTTFEKIEALYRAYCGDPGTDNAPRPQTVEHNLARLKLMMTRAGVETIEAFDSKTLAAKWFGDTPITDARRTTYRSALGAAASVFNADALAFYAGRKKKIVNPFAGIRVKKPQTRQYSPLSAEVRKSIWEDCLTELPAADAMIVRLALGAGFRRAEIEAALVSWFVPQGDTVNVTIHANENFTPKSGKNEIISISRADYDTLLKLRGKNDSLFFVPGESAKVGAGRLLERSKIVNLWIKKKGSTNAKPLHGLRKELGSLIAKTEGIPAAAAYLRNTVAVCLEYYVGVEGVSTPNLEASFTATPAQPVSEEQALAAKLGIPVEELLARLAKPA